MNKINIDNTLLDGEQLFTQHVNPPEHFSNLLLVDGMQTIHFLLSLLLLFYLIPTHKPDSLMEGSHLDL